MSRKFFPPNVSVKNFHETETVRGCRHPRGSAVRPLKEDGNIVGYPFAESDFNERTDHDPHHVPQKPRTPDINVDKIAVATDLHRVNTPHGGFRRAPRRPEGGEIMLTDEKCGSPLHSRNVEFPSHVPGIEPRKGRATTTIVDPVTVMLPRGVGSGIKAG